MKVTFSDAEVRAIDALRGGMPRATWVRQLVRQAAVAADALGSNVTVLPTPEPVGPAVPGVFPASEFVEEPPADEVDSSVWPPREAPL